MIICQSVSCRFSFSLFRDDTSTKVTLSHIQQSHTVLTLSHIRLPSCSPFSYQAHTHTLLILCLSTLLIQSSHTYTLFSSLYCLSTELTLTHTFIPFTLSGTLFDFSSGHPASHAHRWAHTHTYPCTGDFCSTLSLSRPLISFSPYYSAP